MFAAVGAFLQRHALGAHPANYAFAFSVVTDADGDTAQAVARIEADGFRLTADEIERLGGQPVTGAPVSVPATAPTDIDDRATALIDRTHDQVDGFSATVRTMRAETREFGDDLAAAILARSELRAIDEVAQLTSAMIDRVRQAEVRLEVATSEAEALRHELEEARGDARSDPLTGLANRRAFGEAFARRDPTRPAAIAICDIDRFKAVNDIFGHAIGDRVLRAVGATIAEACDGCLTARYGGEEFVVLLPYADAAAVIERARLRIAGKRFRLRETDASVGSITFSAGVAMVAGDDTLDDALARADASLYAAKLKGRNQVQLAD